MKNLLNTNTSTFQEIMGNGKKYKIPDFQRDYSWSESNWEDLWDDLVFIEKEKTIHYMGAIVLQSTETKNLFYIIDGQQRITTIEIIIVAIIKFLTNLIEKGIESENNKKRKEKIENMFIGDLSISTLHYDSKLKLNKNNDTFFQSKILVGKKVENISSLRDSEKLLYGAYKYFLSKIENKFKNDNGQKLGKFLETIISDQLIFTNITVESELEAYTVFETLNARGVELTTTDLLKNYLFAVASKKTIESEMDILKEKWAKIVDKVGLKTFPVFLRYFLNARQDLVRKEFLFKVVKKQIKEEKDVFNLIEQLESKANLYNAIKNPEDIFWNDFGDKEKIQKSLQELKLFKVSQPIPLLFALYDNKKELFSDILNKIVVISFRYNVISKKNPNELERLYNKLSTKITSGKIKTKQEIINYLNEVYINDDEFKNVFTSKEITSGTNRKIVKYILTKIENHISNKNYDYNDANLTIEHILPENYNENWNENFQNEASKFIYRLGNYTLLEANLNRQCANKNYEEKKEFYKKSSIKLSNEYVIYDEWNIQNLSAYQKKLAKIACGVWKN